MVERIPVTVVPPREHGEAIQDPLFALPETGEPVQDPLFGETNEQQDPNFITREAPVSEPVHSEVVPVDEPAASPSTATSTQPFKVVIVDQSSDAHDEARDRADARLDHELGEGGGVKRFLNGIWKGNVAKDYYRQRYVREELNSMQDANDVHVGEDAARRSGALQATIDRFSSEYDELVHTEAGEHKEVQDQSSDLSRGIKQLIREYAEGQPPNAARLQEERTRLLNQHAQAHGAAATREGIVTADNLLAIAEAVTGSIEHGASLDDTLAQMQIITGEARNGARTEARYNAVDRAIDKLAATKVGSLVTPGVLATGVSIAASLARVGSHSVVGAVTKTLLPGVAAGAWAGLRENRRVKDERAQHAREMTVGGEFSDGDTRREQMEKTRYETVDATDITSHLKASTSAETLQRGGNDALQAALDALAAIQTRVQLSDSEKIDLISYSSKTDVGEQRMLLDLARRDARLSVEAELTDEARTALGLDAAVSVKDLIQQRAALFSETLKTGENGVEAKDAAFAKLKARRVATAAAIGVVGGIAGGLVAQEALAAVDSTRFGLIDSIRGVEPVPLADGEVHQTILEGLVSGGGETTAHVDTSETYASHSLVGGASLELSDDHDLVTNEDGTIDFINPLGELAAEGLVVDENGAFDQASLDKIAEAGMVLEDTSYPTTEVEYVTSTVSVEEYVASHPDQTTNVVRDFWYTNDTPAFDENEKKLWLGAEGNWSGITEEGYQYTIANMSEGGSWQGGESVDWNQAATNGNLFVAISASADTQSAPFMVPVGPDGTINISADSPAGQFFANEGGEAAFKGAYMEVVETASVDPDGTVHVRPLATIVGDQSVSEMSQTTPVETVTNHIQYSITSNGYDTTQSNFTEMAPVIPIASRRSMEALHSPEAATNIVSVSRERSPYGYYNGEVTNEYKESVLSQISPRLRNNPDAVLNPGEELDWYRNELANRLGASYVSDIEAYVDATPALDTMNSSVNSIVTMPVQGTVEEHNIYKTLSLLAQQDRDPSVKTTVLMNVNWVDTDLSDSEKSSAIQRTLSEIERARADFPQLSLAVMKKEYKRAAMDAVGAKNPIGFIVDDLNNTALLAIQRCMAKGKIDKDHDVLLVRSDADVNGQSRRHLYMMEKAARENPTVDVIKGVTRYGISTGEKFPGFSIVSNFSSALQIASAQNNIIHTGGANFAMRASTMAAVSGLGPVIKSGSGSDDVEMGSRISIARGLEDARRAYGDAQKATAMGRISRVKSIAGAAIDTSADRMLPSYIKGASFQDAWDPSAEGNFESGPRDQGEQIIKSAEKERYPNDDLYATLEVNITKELSFASEQSSQKALAIFFGSVPGAYIIRGELGTESVKFEFTDAGRAFIKNRVQRETNGRYGSYGARKMRQLYGSVKPEANRRPAGARSPLVTPLT